MERFDTFVTHGEVSTMSVFSSSLTQICQTTNNKLVENRKEITCYLHICILLKFNYFLMHLLSSLCTKLSIFQLDDKLWKKAWL